MLLGSTSLWMMNARRLAILSHISVLRVFIMLMHWYSHPELILVMSIIAHILCYPTAAGNRTTAYLSVIVEVESGIVVVRILIVLLLMPIRLDMHPSMVLTRLQLQLRQLLVVLMNWMLRWMMDHRECHRYRWFRCRVYWELLSKRLSIVDWRLTHMRLSHLIAR